MKGLLKYIANNNFKVPEVTNIPSTHKIRFMPASKSYGELKKELFKYNLNKELEYSSLLNYIKARAYSSYRTNLKNLFRYNPGSAVTYKILQQPLNIMPESLDTLNGATADKEYIITGNNLNYDTGRVRCNSPSVPFQALDATNFTFVPHKVDYTQKEKDKLNSLRGKILKVIMPLTVKFTFRMTNEIADCLLGDKMIIVDKEQFIDLKTIIASAKIIIFAETVTKNNIEPESMLVKDLKITKFPRFSVETMPAQPVRIRFCSPSIDREDVDEDEWDPDDYRPAKYIFLNLHLPEIHLIKNTSVENRDICRMFAKKDDGYYSVNLPNISGIGEICWGQSYPEPHESYLNAFFSSDFNFDLWASPTAVIVPPMAKIDKNLEHRDGRELIESDHIEDGSTIDCKDGFLLKRLPNGLHHELTCLAGQKEDLDELKAMFPEHMSTQSPFFPSTPIVINTTTNTPTEDDGISVPFPINLALMSLDQQRQLLERMEHHQEQQRQIIDPTRADNNSHGTFRTRGVDVGEIQENQPLVFNPIMPRSTTEEIQAITEIVSNPPILNLLGRASNPLRGENIHSDAPTTETINFWRKYVEGDFRNITDAERSIQSNVAGRVEDWNDALDTTGNPGNEVST